VIDVETTGLSAAADRVLELAAVRCTAAGEVLGELHTLVDPECPVAATFVHGVDDRMVAGAPCFRDVADLLLALLDGAVVVAHNAAFDVGFVQAELERSGIYVGRLPRVCTMALRRQVGLPGPPAHRLRWACWQEGVPIQSAHAAVCDARATGALASRYFAFASDCGHSSLADLGAGGRTADSWSLPLPRARAAQRPITLRQRGAAETPRSLHRQQPAGADQVRVYGLALAAAAMDFEVNEDEVAELHDLVTGLGLTSAQVRGVHENHVRALLDDRLSDGLLTWGEQQEVRAFARLLGVADRTVAVMLEAADQLAEVEGRPSLAHGPAQGAGLVVCITGEFVVMPLLREQVIELAEDAGMTVMKTVSKKVDLLVCRDPDAGTTKLRKALEYGTPLIDQSTFLALAGAQPAPEGVVRSALDRVQERRTARLQAGQQRREKAAIAARERARARARERRSVSETAQVLWCAAGQHEWRRPPQRGRPPRICPEHQSSSA
jgi:DNA polymerase III subunit epsilon